jgi:hypothetical protein
MSKYLMPPIYGLVLLFVSVILFASCGVESSHQKKPAPLEVKAIPSKAGTIDTTGQKVQAKANPGYVFDYWKINKKDGTFITRINNSITINKDSIRGITGEFSKIAVPNIIRSHEVRISSNAENVYFVNNFSIPIDSADTVIKKSKSAIVRENLLNHTKQKILVTGGYIVHFDLSYDSKYLAFIIQKATSSNSAVFITKIYGLKTRKVIDEIRSGEKVLWANRSDKLLIGSENFFIIYFAKYRHSHFISESSQTNPAIRGFTAAAWSPNDKYLLIGRNALSFGLYTTTPFTLKKQLKGYFQPYFAWVNNQSFVTPNYVTNSGKVALFTLKNLNDPKNLPTDDYFPVSVSPFGRDIVYIARPGKGGNTGSYDEIRTYNLKSEKTTTILKNNNAKYDPRFVKWINSGTILFCSGRSFSQIYLLSLNGKVSKL